MMHPTKWARATPFHHMRFRVGDSMIFFDKKKACSSQILGCYYY
jgi:hypothetical protein